MSIGLDAVNLEQAVRDSEVPRSSAYAVWSTDETYAPQELFQRSVLRRAVEARRDTFEELLAIVSDSMHELGENPTEADLRDLIRIGTNANIEAVAASRSWQMVMALRAILHSAPQSGQDAELADWMLESEEHLRNEAIETLYKPMAVFFGFEPKPEYGERAWHYLEIAASSFSEGLALRYPLRAGEYVKGLPHPTNPSGPANWSLFALLFEQIVETFFQRTSS